MRVLLRSNMLWLALFVWVIFWPFVFILDRDTLYESVTAIAGAIGIGVLVAYTPGIIRAIRADDRRSGNLLILGIGCTWFAAVGNRVWGWTYNLLGHPEWMLQHPFISFLIWIFFTGGVLHLTAYNAVDGRVPPKAWAYVGGITAAGLIVSFALGWTVTRLT